MTIEPKKPDEVDYQTPPLLSHRFRGYLPVVIDIETGGFNAKTDAILELGACFISTDETLISTGETVTYPILPFTGAHIDPASLAFTGIDVNDPNRDAISEHDALKDLFSRIRSHMHKQQCKRAILVAHNAHFDQQFLQAAIERSAIKRDPFHPFSVIDTCSLSALAYGHTVLAKACQRANLTFDNKQAHRADYDALMTAKLFCTIVNQWQKTQSSSPGCAYP